MQVDIVREKGGVKVMRSQKTKIREVDRLLDESFRLFHILRATKNSDSLRCVVLADLEDQLKKLYQISNEKLLDSSSNETKIWYFLSEIANFLYEVVFNATLHCKLFCIAKFNIY